MTNRGQGDTMQDTGVATARFGYWAALGTGVTTLATFVFAIWTPPLSGELCQKDCISYPYLDIAARFPRDYYWMVLAIVSTVLYVAFTVALQARAAHERHVFAQLGLALCVMAALTIIGDYFVQLAVIQPSVLADEADGVSLLTQYNPHGVFIALEELGYLLQSLSLMCMALAVSKASRLERMTRRLFIGGFIASVSALCWFVLRQGHQRGSLLEIVLISINWTVLIAGALIMAAVFHRDLPARPSSGARRPLP